MEEVPHDGRFCELYGPARRVERDPPKGHSNGVGAPSKIERPFEPTILAVVLFKFFQRLLISNLEIGLNSGCNASGQRHEANDAEPNVLNLRRWVLGLWDNKLQRVDDEFLSHGNV